MCLYATSILVVAGSALSWPIKAILSTLLLAGLLYHQVKHCQPRWIHCRILGPDCWQLTENTGEQVLVKPTGLVTVTGALIIVPFKRIGQGSWRRSVLLFAKDAVQEAPLRDLRRYLCMLGK